MARLLGGLILALAVGLALYAAFIRPQRHPLLIDAAWPAGGAWCDVNHPRAPRPRVRSTIEPRRAFEQDQRTFT